MQESTNIPVESKYTWYCSKGVFAFSQLSKTPDIVLI